MTGREALGAADVGDDVLAAMVARSHGESAPGVLEDVQVIPVDYDLAALSTAARHHVRGSVRYAGASRPFSLFVKQVQSWERSEIFQQVPPEVREMAAAGFPWRIEPLVYRSDLAERLPAGLRMPAAYGVFDLDDLSASIWLEEIPVRPVLWDLPRYEAAAHLLGRLAGSPAVAEVAGVGEFEWTFATYIGGRLVHQVIPMLQADPLWQHPLISGAFSADLRNRLLAAADRVWELGEELMSLPTATAHGDACPNNLLVRADEDNAFTLIDFGFFMEQSVGFDLGQLLVGDVQLGRAGSADLAHRGEACLRAYLGGLEAEGCRVDERAVRRGHALHLLLFTGLATLPVEHLEASLTPQLQTLAADRAVLSSYALDLVERTG